MINFASLFGGINRTANSAVNDLLDKPDTTLQQLLDIESFLNQYKSNNAKVNEFMKYDKYVKLVNYVTVQGPANDQKKGFKFPMVAADVLSVEKDTAIQLFLPDGAIQVDFDYQSTEQIEFQVDDNDEQYLTEQTEQTQPESEKVNVQKPNQAIETEGQQKPVQKLEVVKKTKIVREVRPVIKSKKIKKEPLMEKLLTYFQGPVNYTLAGYTCKVLSTLFTKKPTHFFKFLFSSNKNYVQLIGNHIESKSVGDLILKVLIYESVEFVKERQVFYDYLIRLMSELKNSHVISNLAYTIHEIIEKTSVYIKSKVNITNNQNIIQAFMRVFYRTEEVHKIINNTIDQDQNRSGYNCHVLHAYLHHTEIQTFNSFKLEEVLQSFIKKASQKLRNIPNKRVLGMGRVKIVEIFSFLIRKPRKTLDDQNRQNDLSKQLLQQLYLHEMISQVPDFFSILLKLVQSFENNNILHNQVFRILEAILREPQQNKSSLQLLLLNDENVLLKFILHQAQVDKETKKKEKNTRRKGYIGHVINLCKLIDQIQNNQLLNQKIKQSPEFVEVLNSLVAADLVETNKNLAGYQMKKNPVHQIMFQKQDILAAYSQFLSHCPKPVFEQEKEPVQQTAAEHEAKLAQQRAQLQLQQQQQDEQKFNERVAVTEQLDQSQPAFWRNHLKYDIDSLMEDL